MRCRLGGGEAPCMDDLCHNGSRTLCGIFEEELYEDEFGEEYDDDPWPEDAEER